MKEFRIGWKEYPWDFNEVVGWIRLFVRAESIGAALFVVNKKYQETWFEKKFAWDSSNFIEIPVSEGQTPLPRFRFEQH